MKPWHLRDPNRFATERAEVENAYPELHFYIEGDQIKMIGTLPIKDGSEVFDRFSILIILPTDFPRSLPNVYEIGGRIPRTADRHVNSGSGEACVLLPEERWRVWSRGSSLLAYFNGPLRNYFLGQAMVELGEPWPFGERSHGIRGLRDYYNETLGTDDPRIILKYLHCLSAKKPKGHWDCPCGSGKRLRACHMPLVLNLRNNISPDEGLSAAKNLVAQMQHAVRP